MSLAQRARRTSPDALPLALDLYGTFPTMGPPFHEERGEAGSWVESQSGLSASTNVSRSTNVKVPSCGPGGVGYEAGLVDVNNAPLASRRPSVMAEPHNFAVHRTGARTARPGR